MSRNVDYSEALRMKKSIDDLSINTLRMLSLDMVEKARSGHPGLPVGGPPWFMRCIRKL